MTKHVSSQDVLRTLRQSQFDLVILAHGTSMGTELEVTAMADEHTHIIRLGELTLREDLLDRIRNVIQIDHHA